MIRTLLPIVEGHSEVIGVPVLLRRLLINLGHPEVLIARPFRVKRNQVVLSGELERALLQGIQTRTEVTGILVILDADDDDPDELETSLAKRCHAASAKPTAVVTARREMESWFLGSKDSLRGVCGIRADAKAPEAPESIRGAKERLTRNMEGDRCYVEVKDQPVMAAKMDLDLALQRCPSFQRLFAELERLLVEIS